MSEARDGALDMKMETGGRGRCEGCEVGRQSTFIDAY